MPIRPKNPPAAPQQRAQVPSPPPRRRIVPKPDAAPSQNLAPAPENCAAPSAAPKRKRGHAQKDARGKFMPTGDYPVGFGRPPLKSRFDGSRPGPGRPKGARSQASIEREELLKTRPITENGVATKSSQRELATKLYFKLALEGQNRKDLLEIMALGRQHFPDTRPEDEAGLGFGSASLDQAILAQFFAGLQLGEPGPEAGDPFALAAFGPGAGGGIEQTAGLGADDAAPEGSWDEGDWGEPGFGGLSPEEEDEEDGDEV